jgi:diadenosine tetraphosphate (Ap4A) HIT family hydrolase
MTICDSSIGNKAIGTQGSESSRLASTNGLSAMAAENVCEFCSELGQVSTSRFATIYGPVLNSRIVAQAGDCVAMPTLGQLFRGSLLVLPVKHIETMAEANGETVKNLVALVSELTESMKLLGLPLLVEHGAQRHTGAACGVYHAHMHVIPLPGHVRLQDLLPGEYFCGESLAQVFWYLRGSSNYLVCRDTFGRIGYVAADALPQTERFTSQHVRRKLAERFKLDADWDWRTYREQEPWVLETLRWFGEPNVLVGQ